VTTLSDIVSSNIPRLRWESGLAFGRLGKLPPRRFRLEIEGGEISNNRVQSFSTFAIENIVRSLENSTTPPEFQATGSALSVVVAYGDALRCARSNKIAGGTAPPFSQLGAIHYTYFGANLGSAGGHNACSKSPLAIS